MDNYVCQECQKDCRTEASLLKHLRAHKITQAVYFQRHFPRYDKYDKSIILFKNREHYFNTDFNSRSNAVSWFSTTPPNEATRYLSDTLLARRKRKELVYAPSQVELRTIGLPGIRFITKLVGDYNVFCERLGFKTKFANLGFMRPLIDISNCFILIDNREQAPLSFKLKILHQTLPYADYTLNRQELTGKCFVERKAINDFYGTMTGGIERFRRELQKAKYDGAYVVIIIEGSIEEVTSFPRQRHVYGKVRISPEFVFHSMRGLIKDFDNIQFLFTDNRTESSRVIEKLFACNGEYKNVDLQLMYDRRIL